MIQTREGASVLYKSSGNGREIVNLCFHGIGEPGRPLEPDEDLYWVDEDQFLEILDVVAGHPSVCITFDDGNASDASIALAALRERGLTAKFFVVADRIGEAGSLRREDIRDLVRNRMVIGSHGKGHRAWRSVRGDELGQELAGAASVIADAAGHPVREVACPFGSYDRRVLAAIRRAGFERVYTVDGGPAQAGAWLQPRYTVRAADTPADIDRRIRFPRSDALPEPLQAAKLAVKRWR